VAQPLQLCHYKKFFFLLDRLSATDGQLNNVLQLSMIFCDFVQNIFKKALFIAKYLQALFDGSEKRQCDYINDAILAVSKG